MLYDSIPKRRFKDWIVKGEVLALIIYAVIFCIYVAMQSEYALSVDGITTLLNGSVVIAIAAAAETFVILAGGFDLSVAGIVILTNTIVAVSGGSLGYGGEFAASTFSGVSGAFMLLIISLVLGAIVGCFNGFLVVYIGLQAIAATLGTMIICSGVALLLLAQPGGNVPDSITYGLSGNIGPIPVVAIIMAVVMLTCWLILRKTNFGRGLYAIGEDRTAAELSGIAVRNIEFKVFVIAGILSGLSGYMLSVQTGTGSPQLPKSLILLIFAAVAIGGTSFEGGRGSVIGSMIGAGVLAVLQKMLFAIGVSTFYTGIFQGVVMILAMILSTTSAKWELRSMDYKD